jgi:hypothetical protein
MKLKKNKNIEDQLIQELKRLTDKKVRYNFTLSQATKEGLAKWCKKHGFKESTALDSIIRKNIPDVFFKD